jgi:hypothetical protein
MAARRSWSPRAWAGRSAIWLALVLWAAGGGLAAAQEGPGGASEEAGAELRVWLVTIGPGTAIWERFGHNALRVVDTRTGYDASYNWGIFDFNQVDFVPRFLRGEMLYMMAPFASEPMIDMYRSAGREVLLQELDLPPAQRLELRDFAEWNALPANREYHYDYFLDNCSTRVRDLLDRVLGGALFDQFGSADTGTSYRYHTRRLTQPDPVLFTGMDILLGTPGDRPITRWAEMFIPMSLRDAVREVRVDHGDGTLRPLVISEEVVAEARVASEPDRPPRWWPRYLLLGLVLGVGMAGLGRSAASGSRSGRVAFGAAGALWSGLAGFSGVILVLVLFTDHRFMVWNENLLLLNPASLGLALLVPLALVRPSVRRAAAGLATGIVLLGVAAVLVGLAPFAIQENALQIALFLPIHIGLWGGLRVLATADPAPGPSANVHRRRTNTEAWPGRAARSRRGAGS